MTHELYVLLFREGGYWLAQGLQLDLAAQGRTVQEARLAFVQILAAQIRLGRLDTVSAAPAEYWAMWGRAVEATHPAPLELPPDIPPAYVVQTIVGGSDQHSLPQWS